MSDDEHSDDHARDGCEATPGRQPIRVSGLQFRTDVGKEIGRLPGGFTFKRALIDARSSGAQVINESFATAAEAFAFRRAATSTMMFFSGTYDPSIPSAGDYLAVPRDARQDACGHFDPRDWHTIVTATKQDLAFRASPGLMAIDVDVKKPHEVGALWPAEPTWLKSAEEVSAAVHTILPEAVGCPMLVTPSSGSMILDAATGELAIGPGGWRVLVVVDDAREIPRVLEAIHVRCWARGLHRFAFIGRRGDFYPRSLADLALGRPTQPDYPRAKLQEGLARDEAALASYHEDGAYLATASVILSDDDRAKAAGHIAVARAALRPEMERLKGEAVEVHVDRLVKRAVPKRAAERAALKRFESGVLLGSDTITLQDGTEIDASVLLTPAGEGFDGKKCLDPCEPDYNEGMPVGMIFWNAGERPGVHSFAHGSKFWRVQHDAESASKAIDAAGGEGHAISLALALADVDRLAFEQLEGQAAKVLKLGNRRASLRESVEAHRQRIGAAHREAGEAAGEDEARRGPSPLGEKLRVEGFPFVAQTDRGVRVLDHVDNIAHMLSSYGIGYRYNVIEKQIDWSHPAIRQGGDNAETALFSQMLSLCSMNKVPSVNLQSHLTALAERHPINPVTDTLSALKWDGTPRFDALVKAMRPDDAKVARIVIRLFLLQACAAADNAEIARGLHPDYRPSFEGCLVLVAAQGAGKTKGLRRLLPTALQRYFKEGLTLNLHDKDSLTAAVSCWIAELGELDATFKKSDISDLKAFLSKDVDEVRTPYARKASKFARRMSTAGTVNDTTFLADETGNRRFWPLTAGRVDVGWGDAERDQLWAEAWSRYASGEQWWATAREDEMLAANAERYRHRSPIEDLMEGLYQWDRAPDGGRKTALQIYQQAASGGDAQGIGLLTPLVVKAMGNALSRLWRSSPHTRLVNGALKVRDGGGEWVRINADSGKLRGWLLPPLKSQQATGMRLHMVPGVAPEGETGAAEATKKGRFGVIEGRKDPKKDP